MTVLDRLWMARKDLAFEHKVLKPLKRLRSRPRRWLLAVSGGVDSMVLAEFTRRWRRDLEVELAVAHVHHGYGVDSAQRDFRHAAKQLVQKWADRHSIEIFSNEPEDIQLKSEAELRAYRHGWLERWRAEGAFDAIAFAHHSDDQLETRLLRLIRGTGLEGLRAMRLSSPGKVRPLLSVSRKDVEDYARAVELEWVEDPTNADRHALRNWIRHEWLPLLEQKQPGASKALSRSLAVISTGRVADITHVGLRRERIKAVSFSERESLVAGYLRSLGVRDYSQAHVQEILKRIDTRRKNLRFEMLGVVFEITPDFLRASRV